MKPQRLQRLGALLWAAFLGGACSMGAILALPPSWLEHGAGLRELSLLFFVCWALALVPAIVTQMLVLPPGGGRP
ncbi:hypothetical protein C3942_09925 [Solimonas fluminis]|uniref:DUF2798 domain-containing protein n=1 Tax=Solimonas fluminis TaxID=2086571 RepID=A0A2S5TH95_9GAMM|nr:hypothetical protein [Solimonas fluminis]PPE74335.1 hypothetical protein C3942_09925 [Solimonas fluminis]